MDQKIFTTADLVKQFKQPGIKLRRIIRTMPKYDDGIFTRYAWTKSEYEAVVKYIKAKQGGGKPPAAPAKRKPAAALPAPTPDAALPADASPAN